ncbi:uncharacterized protein LOC132613052 [Lycium barbarum]|uniref:uncharacterized protein LOC132613052 n=1 Tax=Lycium barbarum TaxID=112863 RepID=UPI00293E0809|nr:uncharacterized protein LOC132613052 [Lycium barbarum]
MGCNKQILDVLGYTVGDLPFRYFGVPLDSKKLAIAHCIPLIEKITTKIQCWSSKLLSYAGRLQMIKLVLFGLQTYWAQIFILPKKVLKLIEAICRTFLWTGDSTNSEKALVAWERAVEHATDMLGFNRSIRGWNEEVQLIKLLAKRRSSHSTITCCLFAMLVALIWRERNNIRFQKAHFHPEKICKELAQHIHIQGRHNIKWQRTLTTIDSYP